MKVIEVYDDMDWARDETRTPATHRVVITADDQAFGIDLGDENYQIVLQQLKEILGISTRVTGTETQIVGQRTTVKRKGGKPLSPEHARIKEWVDVNQIRHPRDPSRPAYLTSTGLYDWPKWLVNQYRAATGRLDELSA